MPGFAFAGTVVQLPQGALEVLDFALVFDFLPFGQFQCLEHFFHFVEGVLEFVNDTVHLLDGAGDGGRFRSGFGFETLLGFFPRRFGRFNGAGFGGRGFRRFGRGTAIAATRMAAAPAAGASAATRACWRFGLRRSAWFCFVRKHKHRLPTCGRIAKEFSRAIFPAGGEWGDYPRLRGRIRTLPPFGVPPSGGSGRFSSFAA
jgi:hypothetical protein